MPTFKGLTCHVERGPDNAALHEYGTSYGDGLATTYLCVPSRPAPFSIHLSSHGFIAPGLAMFVFIDGEAQCNRNRRDLIPPAPGTIRSHTEVDFRVRQKEEKNGDGQFIARDWRFEKLQTDETDKTTESDKAFRQNVGTIEVVVLRCHGDRYETGSTACNKHKKSSDKKVGGEASGHKKKVSDASSRKVGSATSGLLGGLFDGANDELDANDATFYQRDRGIQCGGFVHGFQGHPYASGYFTAPQQPYHALATAFAPLGAYPYPYMSGALPTPGHVPPYGYPGTLLPGPQLPGYYPLPPCTSRPREVSDGKEGTTNPSRKISGSVSHDKRDEVATSVKGCGGWANPTGVLATSWDLSADWNDPNREALTAQDGDAKDTSKDDKRDIERNDTWGNTDSKQDDAFKKSSDKSNDAWDQPGDNQGGSWDNSGNQNDAWGKANDQIDDSANANNKESDPWGDHDAGPAQNPSGAWDNSSSKEAAAAGDVPGAWHARTDSKATHTKAPADQQDGAWDSNDLAQNTAWDTAADRKAASKAGSSKPTAKATAAQDKDKDSTPAPARAHLKSYWALWNLPVRPTPPAPAAPKTQPHARGRAADIYLVPEEPMRRVRASSAVSATHAVQTGPGTAYAHATARPAYMDGFGAPYAVFAFRYRSAGRIVALFGARVDEVEERIDRGSFRGRMRAYSKDEVVEELARAKRRLGIDVDESLASSEEDELGDPNGGEKGKGKDAGEWKGSGSHKSGSKRSDKKGKDEWDNNAGANDWGNAGGHNKDQADAWDKTNGDKWSWNGAGGGNGNDGDCWGHSGGKDKNDKNGGGRADEAGALAAW